MRTFNPMNRRTRKGQPWVDKQTWLRIIAPQEDALVTRHDQLLIEAFELRDQAQALDIQPRDYQLFFRTGPRAGQPLTVGDLGGNVVATEMLVTKLRSLVQARRTAVESVPVGPDPLDPNAPLPF